MAILIAKDTNFQSAHHMIGTYQYMSPEYFNLIQKSWYVDVWAWALLVIEIFCRVKPWEQEFGVIPRPEEIMNIMVQEKKPPCIPKAFKGAFLSLLESCFNYDYNERPDFVRIIQEI